MQRRSFLVMSAAGLAGLAGCAGVLSDSDDSNDGGDGPDDAARNLFEAAFDGDVGGANAYLHSDAEIDPVESDDVEAFQNADAQVESAEVVEQSGNTATVSVTYSALPIGGSERNTTTVHLQLRTEDGEWRVYDSAAADDGTGDDESADGGPVAPAVQWESTDRTDADGSVTAVEFVHAGGDTVQSSTLSARVSGETASAPSGSEITAGTTLVVPLEGQGNSLPDSTQIELVWSDPDEDSSQILASYALGSPSVGTLGEQLRIE
jgi:hypothetical protein